MVLNRRVASLALVALPLALTVTLALLPQAERRPPAAPPR
jgi:hypothetical protein